MSAPYELIQALKAMSGITHFVETGTNRGDTAMWAAGVFGSVITIEESPAIHGAAVHRLGSCLGLKTILGESSKTLRDLQASGGLHFPAIYWLDAHWGGGDNAGKDRECPLLEEILALNESPEHNIILIDDARLFLKPPPIEHNPSHWPDIATVTYALWNKGIRYVCVVGDVIVALPLGWKPWLVKHLRGEV